MAKFQTGSRPVVLNDIANPVADTDAANKTYVDTAVGNIDTNIADGSITTAKLADDAVTQAKVADDAIGADQVIDNSIGAAALNVSGNGSDNQVLVSDGDGSFSWENIGDAHLADGSVTTPKLADNAVTTVKINNLAVTNAKIADSTITLGKFNDEVFDAFPFGVRGYYLSGGEWDNSGEMQFRDSEGNTVQGTTSVRDIVTIRFNNSAFTQVNSLGFFTIGQEVNNRQLMSHISAGDYITMYDLGSGAAIDGSNRAGPAVQFIVASVNTSDSTYVEFTVTSGATQVVNTGLTSGIFYSDRMEVVFSREGLQIVDGSNIVFRSVGQNALAFGAVTSSRLANGAVGTTQLADNAVTTAKIPNDAVTMDKLADNSVGTQNILDTNVTTNKLADNSITLPKLHEDVLNSFPNTTRGYYLSGGESDDAGELQFRSVIGQTVQGTQNLSAIHLIRLNNSAFNGINSSGLFDLNDSTNIRDRMADLEPGDVITIYRTGTGAARNGSNRNGQIAQFTVDGLVQTGLSDSVSIPVGNPVTVGTTATSGVFYGQRLEVTFSKASSWILDGQNIEFNSIPTQAYADASITAAKLAAGSTHQDIETWIDRNLRFQTSHEYLEIGHESSEATPAVYALVRITTNAITSTLTNPEFSVYSSSGANIITLRPATGTYNPGQEALLAADMVAQFNGIVTDGYTATLVPGTSTFTLEFSTANAAHSVFSNQAGQLRFADTLIRQGRAASSNHVYPSAHLPLFPNAQAIASFVDHHSTTVSLSRVNESLSGTVVRTQFLDYDELWTKVILRNAAGNITSVRYRTGNQLSALNARTSLTSDISAGTLRATKTLNRTGSDLTGLSYS